MFEFPDASVAWEEWMMQVCVCVGGTERADARVQLDAAVIGRNWIEAQGDAGVPTAHPGSQ